MLKSGSKSPLLTKAALGAFTAKIMKSPSKAASPASSSSNTPKNTTAPVAKAAEPTSKPSSESKPAPTTSPTAPQPATAAPPNTASNPASSAPKDINPEFLAVLNTVRQIANGYKSLANNLVKQNSYLKARDAYNEAIRAYTSSTFLNHGASSTGFEDMNRISVDPVLYLNRGFVSMKLHQFNDAIEDFTLSYDGFDHLMLHIKDKANAASATYTPEEVLNYIIKCLWRRGESYKENNDAQNSLNDYSRVLALVEKVKDGNCIVGVKEVMEKIDALAGAGAGKETYDRLKKHIGKFPDFFQSPELKKDSATVAASEKPTQKSEKAGVSTTDNAAKTVQNNVDSTKKPVAPPTATKKTNGVAASPTSASPDTTKPTDPTKNAKSTQAASPLATPKQPFLLQTNASSKCTCPKKHDLPVQPAKTKEKEVISPQSLETFKFQILFVDQEATQKPFNLKKHGEAIDVVEKMIQGKENSVTFVAARGIDYLASPTAFHHLTATSHLRVIYKVYDLIGSKSEHFDQFLPHIDHVFSTILSSLDEVSHLLLIHMTAEQFLTSDKRIEDFYENMKPNTGTRFIQLIDRIIVKMDEPEVYQMCASILSRLFEFSPSWLQRKFNYNLKQFITMVLHIIDRNADKSDIFFLAIVEMIEDIWKYVEMRNQSGIPIKSKKLHSDILSILVKMLDTSELYVGRLPDQDEAEFLYEVFRASSYLLRLLNIKFDKADYWVKKWITYLKLYPDEDVRFEVLRNLGCIMKNNDDSLQPHLASLPFFEILADWNKKMDDIDSEIVTCYFALFDFWVQTDESAAKKMNDTNQSVQSFMMAILRLMDRTIKETDRFFGYMMYLSRTISVLAQYRMF